MSDTPKLILPDIPRLRDLDVYVANGGYGDAMRRAFSMKPDDVIDEVKKSNLRGRGGAAFATGLKWTFMPKGTDKKKFLLINGDESEPGSFKDRQIFEFKTPANHISGCNTKPAVGGTHGALGERNPSSEDRGRAL